MPLYDYQCKCGNKENDVFVHSLKNTVTCSKCRSRMKRLFPLSAKCHVDAMLFPVEGIHLEHVSPKGETFHSVGNEKLCKKA
jgi:hypothetical protein